jgi:undecaprenyl-diphosphatase
MISSSPMSVVATPIVLLILGFLAGAMREKLLTLDYGVMLAIRNANHSAPMGPTWLREMARDVTSLGSTTVLATVILTVGGYFLLTGETSVTCLLTGAALGGLGLNSILKFVFARPRPIIVAETTRLYTSSFPSGHASLSAIVYLTIAALLALHNPALAAFFISFAILLTLIVGLSRIFLGLHYPTDVVAGWCIGASWSMFFWQMIAWLHVEI